MSTTFILLFCFLLVCLFYHYATLMLVPMLQFESLKVISLALAFAINTILLLACVYAHMRSAYGGARGHVRFHMRSRICCSRMARAHLTYAFRRRYGVETPTEPGSLDVHEMQV